MLTRPASFKYCGSTEYIRTLSSCLHIWSEQIVLVQIQLTTIPHSVLPKSQPPRLVIAVWTQLNVTNIHTVEAFFFFDTSRWFGGFATSIATIFLRLQCFQLHANSLQNINKLSSLQIRNCDIPLNGLSKPLNWALCKLRFTNLKLSMEHCAMYAWNDIFSFQNSSHNPMYPNYITLFYALPLILNRPSLTIKNLAYRPT
jgi:hypothetical protein